MSQHELILDGQFGHYLTADSRKMAGANALMSLQPYLPGRFRGLAIGSELGDHLIKEMDTELRGLHFEPLGDILCDRMPDVVFRGYGAQRSHTYGVLILGVLAQASMDFYTAFEDEGSLTTSTAMWVHDIPHRRIYRRAFSGQGGLKGLYKAHLEELSKLTRGDISPRPAPPSLLELTKAIDAYLCRQRA